MNHSQKVNSLYGSFNSACYTVISIFMLYISYVSTGSTQVYVLFVGDMSIEM